MGWPPPGIPIFYTLAEAVGQAQAGNADTVALHELWLSANVADYVIAFSNIGICRTTRIHGKQGEPSNLSKHKRVVGRVSFVTAHGFCSVR